MKNKEIEAIFVPSFTSDWIKATKSNPIVASTKIFSNGIQFNWRNLMFNGDFVAAIKYKEDK